MLDFCSVINQPRMDERIVSSVPRPGKKLYLGMYDLLLLVGADVVNSDLVVREGSEDFQTVVAPGNSIASEDSFFLDLAFTFLWINWWGNLLSLLGDSDIFLLVHEIVDQEAVVGGDGDPLHLGVESDGVDGGTNVEFFGWAFEVVDAPDSDVTILATGSEVGTVGGDGEGIDEGIVSLEGVLDLEVGGPDLQETIPADGGDVWVLGGWGISDFGNPVGVGLFLEGEFAVTDGVPELDVTVRTTGQDLSVVWGESNGQDFLGVAKEESRALLCFDVPETDGLIPRGGQKEVVAFSKGQIGDEVAVASEHGKSLAVRVVFVSVSGSWVEFPDQDGSVSG